MSGEPAPSPDPSSLEGALGVELDAELLGRALTHRSYAYENGGLPTNERLEFLGDAVLGLVVTDALYTGHPDLPEGQLAKLRASVVNMRALADVARRLGPDGLGAYVRLGRGEEATGGRDKASILADTLEALLGAVYVEHGLDQAGEVVHRLFDPVLADAAQRGAGLDWKTSLQELTAALSLGVPEYVVPRRARTTPSRSRRWPGSAASRSAPARAGARRRPSRRPPRRPGGRCRTGQAAGGRCSSARPGGRPPAPAARAPPACPRASGRRRRPGAPPAACRRTTGAG